MCINCKMQASGGDMASRMGICDDTGKPVAYFVGTQMTINDGALLLNIDNEEATDIAYKLFSKLNGNGTILYYCEDHFSGALKSHFLGLLSEEVEEVKRVILTVKPIDRVNLNDGLTFTNTKENRKKLKDYWNRLLETLKI